MTAAITEFSKLLRIAGTALKRMAEKEAESLEAPDLQPYLDEVLAISRRLEQIGAQIAEAALK